MRLDFAERDALQRWINSWGNDEKQLFRTFSFYLCFFFLPHLPRFAAPASQLDPRVSPKRLWQHSSAQHVRQFPQRWRVAACFLFFFLEKQESISHVSLGLDGVYIHSSPAGASCWFFSSKRKKQSKIEKKVMLKPWKCVWSLKRCITPEGNLCYF